MQVYPMDGDALGALRMPAVISHAAMSAAERVRALARIVNIPTERVDAALAAELELEFERGRTTVALASPLDAIERVRNRISAGDPLDEPLAPRRELSAGYSLSSNPLVATLTEKFEGLGYEDPAETAHAIARTVRRRAGQEQR